MDKNAEQNRHTKNTPHIIKDFYNKLAANIILNGRHFFAKF
jgi:hypothetical protein